MDKEARKRRRERILIILSLIFIAGFTYVEIVFLNIGFEGPTFNSVFFFALINLNVILLLLLIFLVVRNFVKLLLERKRKEPGARLKTRLVAGFVGLALMPTLFLFIKGIDQRPDFIWPLDIDVHIIISGGDRACAVYHFLNWDRYSPSQIETEPSGQKNDEEGHYRKGYVVGDLERATH